LESNWRFSVAWLGLDPYEFPLAARRFTIGLDQYWLVGGGLSPNNRYFVIRSPDGTLHSWQPFYHPGLPNRFPYGQSVEPD